MPAALGAGAHAHHGAAVSHRRAVSSVDAYFRRAPLPQHLVVGLFETNGQAGNPSREGRVARPATFTRRRGLTMEGQRWTRTTATHSSRRRTATSSSASARIVSSGIARNG